MILMKSIRFPMFPSKDSSVRLADILREVPENNWKWVLLDFDGSGVMPRGMTFQELESELIDGEGGIGLSWLELKDFSESLRDEIDMRIVAVDWSSHVEFNAFLDSDFYVAIEARDSGEWEVWGDLIEGFSKSLKGKFLV